MSYDPRKGQSPYLGMDAGEETMCVRPHAQSTTVIDRARDASARSAAPTRNLSSAPTVMAPPSQRTRVVRHAASSVGLPQTLRRPAGAPARGVAPSAAGEAVLRRPVIAAQRRQAPVAAPAQQPYDARASRGIRHRQSRLAAVLASLALVPLALMARAAALVLAALSIACVVPGFGRRATLVRLLALATRLVPADLSGQLVRETVLGGVLRGDLMVAAVALFVMDWLLLVASARLRRAPERGA